MILKGSSFLEASAPVEIESGCVELVEQIHVVLSIRTSLILLRLIAKKNIFVRLNPQKGEVLAGFSLLAVKKQCMAMAGCLYAWFIRRSFFRDEPQESDWEVESDFSRP